MLVTSYKKKGKTINDNNMKTKIINHKRTNEPTIENIAVPPEAKYKTGWNWMDVAKKMKVGNSVLVPTTQTKLALQKAINRAGFFAYTKKEENGWSVWMIKSIKEDNKEYLMDPTLYKKCYIGFIGIDGSRVYDQEDAVSFQVLLENKNCELIIHETTNDLTTATTKVNNINERYYNDNEQTA